MGKLTRISRRNIILIIGILVAIFIGISTLLMQGGSDQRTSRQQPKSEGSEIQLPQISGHIAKTYHAIKELVRPNGQ